MDNPFLTAYNLSRPPAPQGQSRNTGLDSYHQQLENEFNEKWSTAQQTMANLQKMMVQDPSKAYQYKRQADDLKFKIGVGQALQERLAQLKNVHQAVQNGNFTDDKKQELLQKLTDMRTTVLKGGVNMWKPGPSNDLSNARGTGNAQRG